MTDCEISGHYTYGGDDNAAGLVLKNGTARRCYVHDNVARQRTAGVMLSGPKARLLDSTVSGNFGAAKDRRCGYGAWPNTGAGGIVITDAGAIVSNCVVTANTHGETMTAGTSDARVGGIWFRAAAKVYNTVISGNTGPNAGGVYGSGYLYNCVIANNVSASARAAASAARLTSTTAR